VILDVVYNHTAETDHTGPTLSFRGIDNKAYYRLQPDAAHLYQDFTGCGNTLNMNNPRVLQLIMDSLRYWVTEMHVDGFRFDLASALARELFEVDRLASFFDIITQDPVLSRVKLIAEPWDLGEGGYQVGNFPGQWAEWNGQYRDQTRRFWNLRQSRVATMVTRFAGSSDLYASAGRKTSASINYITAHDGFTLHDLVTYNSKHNEANLWDNRDGHDDNLSHNCGTEGETDDPAIQKKRRRRKKALIATLLTSQGVPMLLAGDERGRTQRGNNNAYCQDNSISYVDWKQTEEAQDLLDWTSRLIDLRKRNGVLRRKNFLFGYDPGGSDIKDVYWLSPAGEELDENQWHERGRPFSVLLPAEFGKRADMKRVLDGSSLLICFNPGDTAIRFRIPTIFAARWKCALCSEGQHPDNGVDSLEETEMDPGFWFTLGPEGICFFEAEPGWLDRELDRKSREPALRTLADSLGIVREFSDLTGKRHVLEGLRLERMIREILPDLHEGFRPDEVSLDRKRSLWNDPMDSCVVAYKSELDASEAFLVLRLPDGEDLAGYAITILLETGESIRRIPLDLRWKQPGTVVDDIRYQMYRMPIPGDLEIGYYTLELLNAGITVDRGLLVIAPDHAYVADQSEESEIGVTLQLYSIHSSRSLGAGDFRDLLELGKKLCEDGYRVIGLSPLHALFLNRPELRSPYYPSTRKEVHPFYIACDLLPEWRSVSDGEALLKSQAFLPEDGKIDYVESMSRKLFLLEKAYHAFQSSGDPEVHTRKDRMQQYFRKNPEVHEHAVFELLLELEENGSDEDRAWRVGKTDAELRQRYSGRIGFYEYLFWAARDQFDFVCSELATRGMRLYTDVAVGVATDGADHRADPELFARNARAGAPPDLFAPRGQDWGIGVWNPLVLQRRAFRPFRDLLRANMIEDGFLRLDHVMWLFRLFWVHPDGGTYVYYPYRELTAILCLESHLHRCTVIGEDLGTVPQEIEDILKKRKMYSWKVFFFERGAEGALSDPAGYPELSVATLNTHDLPTWNGYWSGNDIEDRTDCGSLPLAALRQSLEERDRDRSNILKFLVEHKLIDDDLRQKIATRLDRQPGDKREDLEPEDLVALAASIHRGLARAGSRLVLTSLNDLTGDFHQPNMPGTIDEYPNWRILCPTGVESISANPYYAAITPAMMEERGRMRKS
ncbi:MAG: 4-alpha-glucanotransferase, partial [Leptospiraceae bacterium]|nr:4-alpha-glucanotransferase [Leptospiraceae bacterium]